MSRQIQQMAFNFLFNPHIHRLFFQVRFWQLGPVWAVEFWAYLGRHTACVFDIHLYLTPLGQTRQFIETCGT
jgi:hypothetical protein